MNTFDKRVASPFIGEITLLARHLSHERDCTTAILDTTASPVVVLNRSGRIERMNRAYERLSGCPLENAVGRLWWELSPASQEAASESSPQTSVEQQFFARMAHLPWRDFPCVAEIDCISHTGETRSIEWTFSVIPATARLGGDGQREVAYFVGVGQDLSAQRAAEERFSRIFYGSPVPIGITTLDEGHFLYANDALLQMFGYKREEFIGRTAVELGLWDEPDARADMARQLREGGRLQNVPLQGHDRAGQLRFSLASFERIEMDGKVCTLCVAADITEHRLLQENLRALAEGISSVSSGAFFESAVRHLAGILEMDYALIGELLSGSERVRTVAQFFRGRLLQNSEYDLAGTPCAEVTAQKLCTVPSGVQQLFPQDRALAEMRMESYVGTPLFDAQGQVTGVLSVAGRTPLSDAGFAESVLRVFATRVASELERSHTEAALRSSENRYRALAEGSATGIWQLDANGYTVYINPAMCRMLEIDGPQELQGRTYHEFFTPESLEVLAKAHALRAAGTVSNYEAEIIGKRGGQRHILVSRAPLSDENGVFLGCIGSVIDMTARKQAEIALGQAKKQLEAANRELEAANRELEERVRARTAQLEESSAQLRESEERLRQLAENVPYVIWMCESDLKTVSYVNSAYEKIWGYSAAQLYAQPQLWHDAILPQDRLHVQTFLDEYKKNGTSGEAEYRILRPDGEVRWIHDRIFAIRDQQGEIYRYAGIAEDITQRQQIEETLRAAHAAAETANLVKSDFLSRMSHEFRTPLNAILGFSQLLELDVENDEQRESIEQILRAGHHLLGMVDEVLDIASIESGQLNLEVKPVCIIELVRECLGLTRILARQNEVSLHCAEASDEHECLWIMGDVGRLRQVLNNYLSNAVKYNRAGGQVHIDWENAANGRLRINVTDNGPGIPAEKIPLLFVPFERLGAESSAVGGSGLGLALCKRLIEVQGGQVGVNSTPGQGSTFWFTLPQAPKTARTHCATKARLVAEQEENRTNAAVPKEPENVPEDGPEASAALRTVLYIEDNLSNYRLMERLFEQRPNLRLIGAQLGREGVALARQNRPDLILLDLQLPDISGEEVLRELKADAALCNVPVIIVSADAIPAHRKNLLEAGAADYLAKPFDLKAFFEVLDGFLAE